MAKEIEKEKVMEKRENGKCMKSMSEALRYLKPKRVPLGDEFGG